MEQKIQKDAIERDQTSENTENGIENRRQMRKFLDHTLYKIASQ